MVYVSLILVLEERIRALWLLPGVHGTDFLWALHNELFNCSKNSSHNQATLLKTNFNSILPFGFSLPKWREPGQLSRYSDWLRAGRPGGVAVKSPGRVKKFSLLHTVQTGSGVHPTSYKIGTGGSYLGVKRQGREADHSPPTSAEVKKMWNYTSPPLYVFMA
jgi:hypothetical protein